MDLQKRATGLFLACCEMPPADRIEFLEQSCGEEPELFAAVERMLAFDGRQPDFLRGKASADWHVDEEELPHSIGEFRIRGKLGTGGMGAVYEAEQERPRRPVALKVMRPFLLSPDALRRFEHEGEFLGRLQHPGIAQVFEVGRAETEHGSVPYLAMEIVRGEPLTEYARNQNLSIEERLSLVARVADAVQHAHQQSVIHRDLKPANILVDASGQPKVLDFGIARAGEVDVQLTTLETNVGQILGTLAYMSPEQASGDSATIDTRSDVYSLGVLLYELLTDRLPYDVSGKSLPEAVRIVQEEAPFRLGTIDSAQRDDLETVVRTALEKDKERRYASAAGLAADIRRYLRHEPIAARPQSRIYTLSMLVRRNRALAGSLGAGFLVLVAGLIVSLVFWARAERREGDVLRLSAIQRVEDLISDANRLWPPHPARIEDYRAWGIRANGLISELPAHRAKRADLRALARPRTEEERRLEREAHPDHARLVGLELDLERRRRALARSRGEEVVGALEDSVSEERGTAAKTAEELLRAAEEIAALEEERLALSVAVDERRDWRFPDGMEDARWWSNQLTKLIEELGALTDEATGVFGEGAVSPAHGWSVPRRLALAQELEAALAPGGEYDVRWKLALPDLALAYPEIELGIQAGLVPLGPDVDSELWEFWHVQSGEEPARDETGKLQPTEETGLVLVLLHGGTFWMGAQGDDMAGTNYDVDAAKGEAPPHEVELEPLFLSKYEMTQAQWQRVTGSNPSRWRPGVPNTDSTLQHPVEQVDWNQARRVLGWLGLDLPTEAQWEYASRAGSDTPFSFSSEDLAEHANLIDVAFTRSFPQVPADSGGRNDGFPLHAPVGSLAPNAWGLHDVHGNVWEWCLDGYREDFYAVCERVEPVAGWADVASRTYRGGSFLDTPNLARSAMRHHFDLPSRNNDTLGLRPARSITNESR